MTKVIISVGSNLDDPQAKVRAAFKFIDRQSANVHMSQLYLTQAVGPVTQAAFVNAAIRFDTALTAPDLLKQLLEIERKAGRDRSAETPKGPRVLDLDIILFGTELWSEKELHVPHPRFRERRFVLAPMAEIAANMLDPLTHKNIAQLLAECTDKSWIKPLEKELNTV
ncbi:MAG: 2-amino-4-hydroxy-6-hydroxymethyldihydropteridine diphosphokinase [Candidatus Marinimicrobia bacterium]|nr:2-amino-4-hydroxy-6-hydroxymethyldihydropteridine diphosphokinase [Candidatus Neomarinimicrobiota bacterium]